MDLSTLSDADLMALKGGDLTKLSDDGLMRLKGGGVAPAAPKPEKSFARTVADTAIGGLRDVRQLGLDSGGGLFRGAGSIGSTLARPFESGAENAERRKAMDAGLQTQGVDTDSLAFGGGKLTAEILGTAGAGGVVANGARVVGAAPTVVSSIASGGLALRPASFVGPVAPNIAGNAITRLLGGVSSGAAMAGLTNPENAGMGAIFGGALPGVVKVAGAAGNALYNLAEGGSRRLMQSAIKPTIAQLKSGDAAIAVQTLLDKGISPNAAGVSRLRDLIDDLNNQISGAIGSSTATVSKQKVLSALDDTRAKFGNQVSPSGDLKSIMGVADDFAAHPNLPVGDAIPVQTAQSMKQGTYKVLSKKYGQIGSAETEAQKGLARGLKEEVANAVPGVQALNEAESRMITTLHVSERRALMELNKNPVGLSALAGNPAGFAAFMADRSAAFKAIAARMINASAPKAGAAGQRLLGATNNPLLRDAVVNEASP